MATTTVPRRLLEVQDLHTEFVTPDGVVRAVDGVSFDLAAGEMLGLVGESGCGKSVTALSLMRLVTGRGRIARGKMLFQGRDLAQASASEMRRIRGGEIAMIFQDPMTSLNPVMAVGRQIAEALELHRGLTGVQARRRSADLLRLVGIPEAERRLKAYPHQFSGGMRQRVMIAMALSCEPRLILADEITTALDVTIQAQILQLLRGLARESDTGFMLITHDLGIVAGMTQRVHVMYAGRIVEKAETRELFASPAMPYSWGLLRSVPRLGQARREKLVPIEGIPPDLISPPAGCRFEARCPYRRAICSEREPTLRPAADRAPGHEVRCWGTQDVPEGGWLIGIDWRQDSGDPETLRQIRQEVAYGGRITRAGMAEAEVGGNP